MGVPVKRIVFSIVPVQPFRLDLTAWALRRRPANTIDCWDGETFRRALMIDGQIVKVAVRQDGQPERARLQVRENMLRNASLIPCLAVALLNVGCSNTPAAPPDTRAADVQAVKDVEAAWVKDVAAKDADKWATYFTEDGSGLYPGDPLRSFSESCREELERLK
jgi:hypothetical protein